MFSFSPDRARVNPQRHIMAAKPAVPTSEEVTAYLAAHKLEPVIEDAVNDAVLKQVKVRGHREGAGLTNGRTFRVEG